MFIALFPSKEWWLAVSLRTLTVGGRGTTSWSFGVEPLLYGVLLSVENMLWNRWRMLKVAILVPRFLDARWTCANKLNTGWAELSKAYGVWHHSGQLVNLVAPTLYTCTRTRASSSLVDETCWKFCENTIQYIHMHVYTESKSVAKKPWQLHEYSLQPR